MTLEDQIDRMVQDLAADGEPEPEKDRAAIQADLEQERVRGEQGARRAKIVEELLDGVIEVPVDEVEEEARNVAWQMAKAAHGQGAEWEQAIASVNVMVEECKRQARMRCKLNAVLTKLAIKWKLRVGEDEMREEAARIAQGVGAAPGVVLKHLAESGGLQDVRRQILTRKVWERLEKGQR